jgi:hypothetical protein
VVTTALDLNKPTALGALLPLLCFREAEKILRVGVFRAVKTFVCSLLAHSAGRGVTAHTLCHTGRDPPGLNEARTFRLRAVCAVRRLELELLG